MKRETVKWLKAMRDGKHEVFSPKDAPGAADALATDAENKRLKKEIRKARGLLGHAMTFVDVGDADRVLSDALKPRKAAR